MLPPALATLRPRSVAFALRVALGVATLVAGLGCATPQAEHLTVAAAASLRRAMPELIEAGSALGLVITPAYGGSGTLRQQVEAGAPIDAVVFAAAAPVNRLEQRGLLRAGTRRVVATNELVLAAQPGPEAPTFATLVDLPPSTRIAVGDPRGVPAGQYAKEALQSLGVWDALQPRLVFGSDVTAVVTHARRGEAGAAIVYATELVGLKGLTITDRAGWPGAPRPQVVAAAVAAGSARASDWVAFLGTEPAQAILRRHGFGAP